MGSLLNFLGRQLLTHRITEGEFDINRLRKEQYPRMTFINSSKECGLNCLNFLSIKGQVRRLDFDGPGDNGYGKVRYYN